MNMKAIVVVGAKHFEEEIAAIFERAGIEIYSRTNISGHKESGDEALRGNWFAISNEEQRSIVFFSFTDEVKARNVLKISEEYNTSIESQSRIRAFIMAVEDHN